MVKSNRIKKNIPHQPGAIDGWNRTLGQEILMPREIVRDKLELSVNRYKVRILSLCHIDGRNRLTFKILNLCHEEHLCTSMGEIGHRHTVKILSLCHDRWILRSWGSVVRLISGSGNSMVKWHDFGISNSCRLIILTNPHNHKILGLCQEIIMP
jgi:hypothetical protein